MQQQQQQQQHRNNAAPQQQQQRQEQQQAGLGPLPSAAAVLVRESVFADGFSTPRAAEGHGVPWSAVREVMAMARDALDAKQCVAERLAREVDVLKQAGGQDKLRARAERAEVDSGTLVAELTQLMQAKAHVAQQRADLDRANSLLVAERQLLCEQLQVPDSANLCQAVSKVLAAAKRTRALDGQLRLFARVHRELLLQLEAQREEAARAASQWHAREHQYQQLLLSHGIPLPDQHPAHPSAAAVGNAAAAPAAAGAALEGGDVDTPGLASSSSNSGGAVSSSAVLLTQLMLMRKQASSKTAAGAQDIAAGSSSLEQTASGPATPPARDLQPPPLGNGTPPLTLVQQLPMRRSHSLDSVLNSLTGLLDQLTLGQLGGAEDDDCDAQASSDPEGVAWLLPESADSDGVSAAAAAAAPMAEAAAARQPARGSAARCGGSRLAPHHHQNQQQLQALAEEPAAAV